MSYILLIGFYSWLVLIYCHCVRDHWLVNHLWLVTVVSVRSLRIAGSFMTLGDFIIVAWLMIGDWRMTDSL